MIDLAINVLSSLLLGTSNYASQILCAPSRNDLNREHSRGRWLDVGVSSIRNLRRLPVWHAAIFRCFSAQHCAAASLVSSLAHIRGLGLSYGNWNSYNSVVFAARSAVDYNAALVTTNFLTGAPWYSGDNFTLLADLKPQSDHLTYMRNSARDWTRIDRDVCLFTFADDVLERDWLNVLLVSHLSTDAVLFNNGNENFTSSVLGVWQHRAPVSDVSWPCNGNIRFSDQPQDYVCKPKEMASYGWSIPYAMPPSSETAPLCQGDFGYGSTYGQIYAPSCGPAEHAPILYCLAQPFHEQCRLNVSMSMLVVVIVCNLVKILCLLATLYMRKLQPLVNLGDAIASFLQNPDQSTEGMGALEVGVVSSGVWRDREDLASMPWSRHRRRWWYAVPRLQLNLTFFLCVYTP